MKKIILLIISFVSFSVQSQFISVSNNTFTNEQLVNTVLLNSACVGGSNITSRTGTNIGINGIGSFTNTNSNFPMTKGIVLSTGNVLNAAGPNSNDQNAGTLAWTGDNDLRDALGNPAANYFNATVLEFDFTPISPKFSFDFIFASEEYGADQCKNFPDAFAFLLTNTVSNVTTNLAVLPNTNIPISVNNVRDTAFGQTCPSVNPSFFGNFYGGTNSGVSPTNFNGETVLLTASSTLIPGVKYHIKLVIADREDEKQDSAVFISGTSFNIGQDLVGPDLTIADKTAVCFGEKQTITTGLNPALYNFQWTRLPLPTILGTDASYQADTPGTYQVSYLENGSICNREINEILVEFYPEIITGAPINIVKCEVPLATTYTFNLALNTPIIVDGFTNLTTNTSQIKYFSDPLCTLPIPELYTSLPGVTVYVKITNTLTNCFTIKPFQLTTIPAVQAFSPGNISQCATTAGTTTVNLSLAIRDTAVLGGQLPAIFSVSYYISQADASSGATNLQLNTANYTATNANGTTIYVRIENKTDATCFATNFFTVTVTPKPEIIETPSKLENKVVCINYTLPALATPGAKYYLKTLGQGNPLPAGTVVTPLLLPDYPTNPVKIFIYLSNSDGCYDEKVFTITILDLRLIDPKPSLENCDDFVVPDALYANYYSESHSLNPNTPIIPKGTVFTTDTTLFIYYKVEGPPSCFDEIAFNIKITKTPKLPIFKNIYKCVGEFYTLPALDPVVDAAGVLIAGATVNYYNGPNGTLGIIPAGTQISGTTKTIYVYATAGNVPCIDKKSFRVFIGLPNPSPVTVCETYRLPPLQVDGSYFPNSGGPSATNIEIPVGTIFTVSKNIWVYIKSDPSDLPSSSCIFNEQLKIKIVLPVVASNYLDLDPPLICEKYVLPALPIIPSNVDVSPIQTYTQPFYNTKADGTGTTLAAGDEIFDTKDIFIVFTGIRPNGTCSKSLTIKVKIIKKPTIIITQNPKECDPYRLLKPSLANAPFGVTFYKGPNKTGGILEPAVVVNDAVVSGTEFFEDTTYYAYSETNTTPVCSSEVKIELYVLLTKAIQLPNINQCVNYPLPPIVQPNTGDNNKYYSASQLNGTAGVELLPGTIFEETRTILPDGTILPVIQTVYVNNTKSTVRLTCKKETTFKIIISPNPDIPLQNPVITCNSYTLPTPTIGNYYTESHSVNPTGGLLLLPNTVINKSQKIYIFAGNVALANCRTAEEPLDITINKVDKLGNVVQCNDYVLPSFNIDDVQKPLEGDYYTQTGGPTGTGVLLPKGTIITPTFPAVVGVPSSTTLRRFYIYKQYPSTLDSSGFCASETFFDVTIISKPLVAAIPLLTSRTFCDDTDIDNDGKRILDLTTFNTTVLGTTQIGSEFIINYFKTIADADNNENPILGNQEFTNNQDIFIRVNNNLALSCFAIGTFKLIINKLPEPNAKDGVICEDNKTGLVVNPYIITTGLNNTNFSFKWKDANNVVVGTSNNLIVSVPGIYSLDITNKLTNCMIATKFITVKLSRIAIASYTLSENFNDNQFVTITAIGEGGDYEYQLDEGLFQDSNIFTEAPFGNHEITVRDKNGCGKTTIPIVVVNYPKYFTPNDDNFNDTWNVIGLEKQLQANIFIYDRFGKLLKQMPTNSMGWDGKLNGQLLPATDYWFTISYLEDGLEKLFKAHFALKR